MAISLFLVSLILYSLDRENSGVRTRTGDLGLMNPALYQLSYAAMSEPNIIAQSVNHPQPGSVAMRCLNRKCRGVTSK